MEMYDDSVERRICRNCPCVVSSESKSNICYLCETSGLDLVDCPMFCTTCGGDICISHCNLHAFRQRSCEQCLHGETYDTNIRASHQSLFSQCSDGETCDDQDEISSVCSSNSDGSEGSEGSDGSGGGFSTSLSVGSCGEVVYHRRLPDYFLYADPVSLESWVNHDLEMMEDNYADEEEVNEFDFWRYEPEVEQEVEQCESDVKCRLIEVSELGSTGECSICLTRFDCKETVTQLSCHDSHIFHTTCWNQWKRSCPLCRHK